MRARFRGLSPFDGAQNLDRPIPTSAHRRITDSVGWAGSTISRLRATLIVRRPSPNIPLHHGLADLRVQLLAKLDCTCRVEDTVVLEGEALVKGPTAADLGPPQRTP